MMTESAQVPHGAALFQAAGSVPNRTDHPGSRSPDVFRSLTLSLLKNYIFKEL